MELLQLRYFLVTAQYQHITRAAEFLHIAQPALSQSIKRLEKELGVSLFIRTGRNVKLSDAGILLAEKLEPVMKTLDEIPGELSHAAEMAARTIKVSILSASEMITDIVILYKERRPEVNFQLSQKIDNQDWDIRVSTVIQDEHAKETHAVLEEEIFLAVPIVSPFAEKDSINLEEVCSASFICLDRTKPFSKLTTGWCMSCGFEPKIVFESDSPSTVRDLIGAGMGVAFWPAYSWGTQRSSKVKLLHINHPSCIRQLYLVRKKEESPSSLKDDFYNFMTARLNDLQQP